MLVDLGFQKGKPDKGLVQRANQSLDLVLGELSQLVLSFTYCFENEMLPWCDKSPPSFSQLGPAFKRVHTLTLQFSKVGEHCFTPVPQGESLLSKVCTFCWHCFIPSFSQLEPRLQTSACSDATVLKDWQRLCQSNFSQLEPRLQTSPRSDATVLKDWQRLCQSNFSRLEPRLQTSPCSDATVLKDWQRLFQSSFSQLEPAFK